MTNGQYIAVENSGMVGEQDVGRFGSYSEAWSFIERRYTDDERDHLSPDCLYPDVCFETNGERTYEI